MSNFRYEVHIVSGLVYDKVTIGEDYLGGVVVDGISGMDGDLLLVVAFSLGNLVIGIWDQTGEEIWSTTWGKEGAVMTKHKPRPPKK